MLAKDLINKSVEPLRTSDTGEKALNLMQHHKVAHWPIVNEQKLLGVVSEQDIVQGGKLTDPLGNCALSLEDSYVFEEQHLFEVLKKAAHFKLSLIPVVDRNHDYLGVIFGRDLLYRLSELFMLDKPGALFVLSMGITDYSLTEIANIVESNNGKILALSVLSHPESARIDLVLKLNTNEVNSIIKTFERYNYQIKAVFDELSDQEGLKERYDMLMKYLNV